MFNVFIGSTGDSAGQSLMAWAFAKRLIEKGLAVGFMKPFGTHPIYVDGRWVDQDAVLFKEAFNLTEPLEKICPYSESEQEWKAKGENAIQGEIKSLSRELSEKKDVLIILGSQHIFFDNPVLPVPDIALINELDADCILLHRYQKSSTSIYSILSISSLLRDRLKGVVFNRIPIESIDEVRNRLVPSLVQKGISITAALEEDPLLSFISFREVIDCLDGKVLCGEACLSKPIGGMTVGSGDLTGELMLFKRAYNKIILLEPCPTDSGNNHSLKQRKVAGILLTGDRSPAPQAVDAARKCCVPLVLVKQDTFASLERLEKINPLLSSEDHVKVLRYLEMLDSDSSLDRLIESLNF
jgi:BioD-like phosphotransacetylase family protein